MAALLLPMADLEAGCVCDELEDGKDRDTVIFVEHDWNPMKDLQAMDRAHRIDQKKVTIKKYFPQKILI